MVTSKLEVLIDFGQQQPDEKVLAKTLKDLQAIDGVKEAHFKDGAIMVETTLPSSVVVDLVSKQTGRRTVLQGFGDGASAVAMVSNHSCHTSHVMGVVRFQETIDRGVVIDGTIDGLSPGEHGLSVHESGDLSQGCQSIGSVYDPYNESGTGKAAGDLGDIEADDQGRATFRIINNLLKVYDIVGRSVAVTDKPQHVETQAPANKDHWIRIACGIIARSAGIFQNPKRICACDGVVVWDERDCPLAGKGRRQENGGQGDSFGPDNKKKCGCKKD